MTFSAKPAKEMDKNLTEIEIEDWLENFRFFWQFFTFFILIELTSDKNVFDRPRPWKNQVLDLISNDRLGPRQNQYFLRSKKNPIPKLGLIYS